jgi:hypothetical protein
LAKELEEVMSILPVQGAETILKELTRQRNSLAGRFEKNPTATLLALEIKAIDDQIAEFTRQIRDNKKVKRRT